MEPSRETTVLFALLIGGDELYAKAGDKKAHEALEHCQFRLGQAAASCGGRLARGAADKLMVLAANPDAAADAASAMHLAMDKLPKTAGVKLALGIGFHYGPVIQKGEEVFGEKEALTVGRDAACGLVVRDEQASRQHCTIERRKDKFVIADVSTNGTYVTIDGEKEILLEREELTLRKRGWIALGQPRAEAKEIVEFFCGPAPVRPPLPK